MIKLAIFDFDGTVVDTITDVGICFNDALARNGFPQHPLDSFGRFVGGNLETVVSRMLPPGQATEENIDRVKTLYRQLYLSGEKPNTMPYPGMPELLEALKHHGVHIAVNSNKGQLLLDDMVKKLFGDGYFDAVIGYTEGFPSKPAPDGARLILQACGCTEADAVYIGDGRSDIDTAANAGIPCIFVCWGQGTPADRHDLRLSALARTPDELYALLLGSDRKRGLP